jgi:hypothetical protein
MAAIAIGMMFRVIESGPIGNEPMGVSENSATTAVSRPRSTSERTLNFVFIIIPPCYYSYGKGYNTI